MSGIEPEAAVEVRNLSKLYARNRSASRLRVRELLGLALLGRKPEQTSSLRKHEFWSLRNISFKVPRGRALGIIGHNGSGKTTMLRVLAGQIAPDRGEAVIRGRVASMIDLTAGFQTGASGRENIFLRGAALGWSRQETRALLRDIVAFSELGDAIDAPVSTYSAGMTMRLAFSIMASAEPDVLLIDEVLGVGDFRFRQKCLIRFREMREKSALVLVSHSMGDVARFCDEVMFLEKGEVRFMGDPQKAIAMYRDSEIRSVEKQETQRTNKANRVEVVRDDMVEVMECVFTDASGAPVNEIVSGSDLRFVCRFRALTAPANLVVGLSFWSPAGEIVTGVSSEQVNGRLAGKAGDVYTFSFMIDRFGLNPGRYHFAIGIVDGSVYWHRKELGEMVVVSARGMSWGAFTPEFYCEIDVSRD